METDRRIRKTLSVLKQTLIELLNEKSLEEITVSELCEKADINRTTFYSHYETIRDLYDSIESTELETLTKIMEPDSTHQYDDLYKAVVDYVFDNQLLYKTLFSINNEVFFAKIMLLLRKTYEEIWQYEINNEKLPAEFKYLETYHLNGIISLLREWCLEGFIIPKDELIRIIKAIDYNFDNLEL